MWELMGLLKAIFTDISGGFHPRRMKNPADDTPIWQLGQDIRDFKDLLKMSRDEMSEEQRQALLNGDEEAQEGSTTLHAFPPSKDELAKLRPGQGEDEELVQKGYEEVIEDPDEDESPEPEASDDSDFPEMPPTLGPSLTWEETSEPDGSDDGDSFDVDLEE